MAPGSQQPEEVIGYHRSQALPGLEILDAHDSPREWRAMGYGYGGVTRPDAVRR